MNSLAEAYEGPDDRTRRLSLGVVSVTAGMAGLLAGIVAATTDLSAALGLGTDGALLLAGILAGLGVPAMLVGVVTVLPASRQVRAGAAVGASIAVVGVALFAYAFPNHWYGTPGSLAFEVGMVYFTGAFVAIWYVFVAVANFKTRNDPHGTVTLEITRGGETRTVEVTREELDDYDDIDDALDSRRGGRAADS